MNAKEFHGLMLIACGRWVKTSLGNGIAAAIGMKEAPVTVEESAAGVFEQVSIIPST